MVRVLDELQAETRALVCGREEPKSSLLFEEEQACDRRNRRAGCSNELTLLSIVEALSSEAALAVLTWCLSLMSSRPRAAPLSADERHQKPLSFSKKSKLAFAVFAVKCDLAH